jgi:hypothetical protein
MYIFLEIVIEINSQMDPADMHIYESVLDPDLDISNYGGMNAGLFLLSTYFDNN